MCPHSHLTHERSFGLGWARRGSIEESCPIKHERSFGLGWARRGSIEEACPIKHERSFGLGWRGGVDSVITTLMQ